MKIIREGKEKGQGGPRRGDESYGTRKRLLPRYFKNSNIDDGSRLRLDSQRRKSGFGNLYLSVW